MKKLFFFTIINILFTSCLSQDCEIFIRDKSVKDSFSGIIKDCYFQHSDGGRGVPTIILEGNRLYYSETYTLICFAQPGDSIIKNKETLKYIIKRKDTTAIFYPECGNIRILDSNKTEKNLEYTRDIDCGKAKY